MKPNLGAGVNQPLLAIETSTVTARVALVHADKTVPSSGECTSARHSGHLLPLVDDVLRNGQQALHEVAAVACGAGPGSFTGLRVGLSLAKGLAFGAARDLVLVPSLDALAHDLAEVVASETPSVQTALLVPCLDAGKQEVYAALFHWRADAGAPQRQSEDWVLTPAELSRRVREAGGALRIICGGPGADRYQALLTPTWPPGSLTPNFPGPSAAAVAQLAWLKLARGAPDDLDAAVPVYGRPPDITLPKPRPPR